MRGDTVLWSGNTLYVGGTLQGAAQGMPRLAALMGSAADALPAAVHEVEKTAFVIVDYHTCRPDSAECLDDKSFLEVLSVPLRFSAGR